MQRWRTRDTDVRTQGSGVPSRRTRRWRGHRTTALLTVAVVFGAAAIPALTPSATALSATQTVDLRVLLIGTTSDPTTAAWETGLTNQGVAYKEVDGVGTLGSQTITVPTLTSSATHGLYNAVVVTGKPGDFVAHALDALSTYESTFGIRQLDSDFVPPAGGILGLNPPGADSSIGSGIVGTSPSLNTAGLAAFPALAGPILFDAGSFAAPGTPIPAGSLPAGATETPLLSDAAANVLIGVYQHPPTGDTQPGVQEMTLGFNYNQFLTQWLLLGPSLIDWVTGGTHLGLYRNYSTIHVDDMFTSDDTWSTTTHANNYDPNAALRMRPVDVDNAATWEKSNNFRLDLLFNGGNSSANATTPVADTLLGEFQKNDPATGKPYTQDFGWLNHTWDHAYLDVGCATTNYVEAEVQQNTLWASKAPGTSGLGGLGLTNTTDNSLALGVQNGTTLVPGGHSGFANLEPGNADAVDPPNVDGPVLATGGSLSSGSYQYAVTDQFNGADPPASDSSSAGVTAATTVPAGRSATLSWEGVCHAANYLVYRKIGTGHWFLIGNVPTPASATPPTTITKDGASPTDTTGGGMQTQTFVDNTAPGTGTDQGATWVPPTSQDAHETAWEQNPNFLTAMNALNMTSVGTDASKPYPNPADNQFGIGVGTYTGATYPAAATFPDGTFQGVPRHPINIFYNNSTETQAVDEYNTLYVKPPGGNCMDTSVTTCLTTPATWAGIVGSVVTGMFTNLLSNDPRPTYVHQTNIMGMPPAGDPTSGTPPATSTAVGDGLLYSVLNPLLAKYHTYYKASTAIQQPTMGAIGTILSEQSGWKTAQPPGTASAADKVTASDTNGILTITNTGTAAVTVPVTAPAGSTVGGSPFGSPYGGTLSAWQTLAPGASLTITTPATVAAQWSLIAPPQGGATSNFTAVSAISTNDVWAAGSYTAGGVQWPLTAHWNGTAWTLVVPPQGGSTSKFTGVSAISTNDVWAAGSYTAGGVVWPLTAHWNGTAWTLIVPPQGGTTSNFTSITAISTNDVWAAGSYTAGGVVWPLTADWNGTAWTLIVPPQGGTTSNFTSITAISTNDVWAAGSYTAGGVVWPLTAHWNGTAWTLIVPPQGGTTSNFTSITAISTNDVWAVGSYTAGGVVWPLTAHWNGTAWTLIVPPQGGTTSNFTSITAISTNDVWAAGSYTAGGVQWPLTAHWNGTAWTLIVPPQGGTTSNFTSITAINSTDVWAVGSYTSGGVVWPLTGHF